MYNKFNFHKRTFATFRNKTPQNSEVIHYKSKHGSSYIFTNKGVYRYSNHWGRVGNCRWRLEEMDYKQQTYYWGYANWEEFYPNDEEFAVFYIEKTHNDKYVYNHQKNSPIIYQYFTAKEAAKRIQKIEEIQQTTAWAKYLPFADFLELQKHFIQQLIHSKLSFQEIKRKYIQENS